MIGSQSLQLEMNLEMISARFKKEETGPARGSDLLTVTQSVTFGQGPFLYECSFHTRS